MALVDVHYSDGIATVTMNDPPTRNAISVPMREEMAGLFQNFEADPEVRCVVLRGAGDHFMSGGDVKTFAGYVREYTKPQLQAGFRQRIATLNPLLTAMRRLPKPILASVQGGAVGAGTGLAMACDLVIAAENAFFVMAYRNIGTSPDGSSSFSLPRAIGMKKAMEMVLLGGRLTAGEALDLGMINFVVPADQLAEETTRIARRLASGPTVALGNAKQLLYRSLENDFHAQLDLEGEMFARSAMTDDFKEGVTAFVEKRRAEFQGK